MEHSAIALAANVDCQLAENPLWHPEKNCLYWTDITAGKIYRLDNASRTHRIIYEGEPVGGFTLQEDDDLLLFRVNDIALLKQDGEVVTVREFTDEGMDR